MSGDRRWHGSSAKNNSVSNDSSNWYLRVLVTRRVADDKAINSKVPAATKININKTQSDKHEPSSAKHISPVLLTS